MNATEILELRCWKGDSIMTITKIVEVDVNLFTFVAKIFHHRTIGRLNLRKIANLITYLNLIISIDD